MKSMGFGNAKEGLQKLNRFSYMESLESRINSQQKNKKLSILLLCDDNRNHAGTILDHISAFLKFSKHDVQIFNPRNLNGSFFLSLDEFDVVVIHYSLVIISNHYLAPSFRKKIHRFKGLKIQFIQDDYRWVDEMASMMRYLGIHILYTLVPASQIPRIWDETRLPGVVKINTLAGYVPHSWTNLCPPPLRERPLDVVYRGRVLPYWLGRLGQDKVHIAQGFLQYAAPYGLKCDIGWQEQDRIYGQAWIDFLCSSKAVLGTESGASITDFDSSLEKRVDKYLAEHPDADFEEVHREILAPFEGNVPINVISPRIFEAVALRTALVLFPGEYSGVIQPWIHYIPLEKDFSNINEVVSKLRDIDFLNAMIERAYCDLINSGKYSYQVMIEEFDKVVNEHIEHISRLSHGFNSKRRFLLAQRERLVILNLKRRFGPIIARLRYFFMNPVPTIKKVLKFILSKPIYDGLKDVVVSLLRAVSISKRW